jgi:HSP20 family protein
MDLKKLAPWNWFRKEQEQELQSKPFPAAKQDLPAIHAHPIAQLHNEIDRLFESAFRGFGFPSSRLDKDFFSRVQSSEWLKPTLDLGATDTEYTISVELPGVEAHEVKLELVNDTLKVSGEKRQEKEERDKGFYRIERSYGSFQRMLSLPEDADQENIKAVFKNGVMTITVPRKSLPRSEVKHIEVTTT